MIKIFAQRVPHTVCPPTTYVNLTLDYLPFEGRTWFFCSVSTRPLACEVGLSSLLLLPCTASVETNICSKVSNVTGLGRGLVPDELNQPLPVPAAPTAAGRLRVMLLKAVEEVGDLDLPESLKVTLLVRVPVKGDADDADDAICRRT